ncbi:MAG TPA: NEW3 domain-containing protein [Acidimicrobiales bacterium]|nr:NEW3 domain-containing protein [Acidimicrobiales bacterium]
MKRVTWLAALAAASIILGGAAPAGAQTATSTTPSHPVLMVVTPYPDVSTQPGSDIKLDLKAYAPHTEPVTLTTDGAPAGWGLILRGGGFVVSGVTADPDNPGTAQLEIQVPPDAKPGGYTLHVNENDGGAASSLPINVNVATVVAAGIGITADFPSLKGGPTDTFTYTLTVTNNTPTAQAFNFAPQAPQGWTVTASPEAQARAATLTIDGGSEAKVDVTATPPATVAAGKYPITLSVTAANGATGQIPLEADVAGTAKLELATASGREDASGHSNKATKETLVVTNSGTADLDNVQLVSTPPKDWQITFDPTSVSGIKPNGSEQVVATITPAKNSVAGDYPVVLKATSGSDSQEVDLRYRVSSSSWLGLFGVLIIVLALGSLAYAFRRFGRR